MPIFDQGYQHWTGTLSGHTWRGFVIARHGFRVGMKNQFVRLVVRLSWLPALALVVVLSFWGLLERQAEVINAFKDIAAQFLDPAILQDPRTYRVEIWTICYDYFLLTELRCSLILILLVGPSLISQDLRFNALPLYFSRPLTRFDYFLGKLGVIFAFIASVIIVPSIIAYVFGLLFSLDLTIIRDTYWILLSAIAYGVVIALSAGMLILALSSLSRNSRYVGLFWLGIWIISGMVTTILVNVDRDQRRREAVAQIGPMEPPPPIRLKLKPGQRPPPIMMRPQPVFQELTRKEMESSRTSWRPLVSYTDNLSRIGRQLLGTDAAWEKLSKLKPPMFQEQWSLMFMGPQYPWYWSAGVLTGLFGISLCILNFRVRSLDRLR